MIPLFWRLGAATALIAAGALAPGLPAQAHNSGQQYKLLVRAPAFSLPEALTGEAVSLAEHDGKVRVVAFWTSWSPYCREELQYLSALQAKYGAKDLQVLAIAADPDEAAARDRYLQQMNFNFPTLVGHAKVKADYGGVDSYPTTFIVGRNGNVYKHYVGVPPKALIEADIKRLI